MNRHEGPDGSEYKFDTVEEWIGKMEKLTFKPGELAPLLFHVQDEATPRLEERFDDYWAKEDEAEFCYHFANLIDLKLKLENAIIEEETPTDAEWEEFLQDPENYSTENSFKKELENFTAEDLNAYRATLEGEN